MTIDYTPITELPGARASREQLAIGYHRYRTALEYVAGKDVLEVACGGGQGLGLLASRARRVVGGDYTLASVRQAEQHYRGRVPLFQLDAQSLPFAAASFDVVLLFEAIYYLQDAEKFLAECRRVLRPEGTLLISSVNREWADFNPSAFSTRYYSAAELRMLLDQHGFDSEVTAAFPAVVDSASDKLLSAVKRAAVRLGLIPKSFKYKAILKRLVYGRLIEYPAEIGENAAPYEPAVAVTANGRVEGYKILYALGRLPHPPSASSQAGGAGRGLGAQASSLPVADGAPDGCPGRGPSDAAPTVSPDLGARASCVTGRLEACAPRRASAPTVGAGRLSLMRLGTLPHPLAPSPGVPHPLTPSPHGGEGESERKASR